MVIVKKFTLVTLLKWIASIGYGVITGYLATTAAEFPPGITDNLSYQNFSIITGAITGLSLCVVAHIFYLIWIRQTKSKGNSFVYVLYIVTGTLIGFLSSYIVHISADSYGLINANVAAIIIGSLIPAIIGGSLPAGILKLIDYD